MSREGALAIIVLVALALLALPAWAWWRRSRRDAGLTAPTGEPPAGAEVLGAFPGLYVATTHSGQALERLAIRGMAFRSRADVTVTTAGVAIDLTGQPRIFLDRERVVDVAQATVTIDRVVERDGLVRLSWQLDDGTVVDSYFRPQDASARAVTDVLAGIVHPTQTGTDA